MIYHADESEFRDLVTKVVRSQIVDTSQFRVDVAEAIRDWIPIRGRITAPTMGHVPVREFDHRHHWRIGIWVVASQEPG